MDNGLTEDQRTFEKFARAAGDFLACGLRYAQTNDPAAYAEVQEALRASRAKIELVVGFEPMSAALRLEGLDVEGVRQTVEVFRFQVPSHGRPN